MRHHTKEEKREILDALREGRTMQDVTKAYDVSYASIRRWRLKEGELDKPRQSYTLKEKAEILIRIEEDKLSDAEAAGIADVNISTIRTWKAARARIIAAYRAIGSGNAAKTMQAKVLSSAYGIEQGRTADDNIHMDKKEEKALKRENEYLRAKTAYLESLLKNLGYDVSHVKKKKIRGNFRSQGERNRQHPSSLLNRRCLKKELLCVYEECGTAYRE